MRVYLAGEQGTAAWEQSVGVHLSRRLMSYYYHGYSNENQPTRDVLTMREMGMDLFLDCGAFSAKAKGETISLAKFMDYCQSTAEFWTVVAALDVIGDDVATWEAYCTMRDAGIKAIPTFHYGEAWSVLKRMCHEVEYMAFGGLVGVPGVHRKEWLETAWDIATDEEGKPYTKVHGFGMTTFSLMRAFPWYSVDSSSWLQIAAFGNALIEVSSGKILLVSFSPQSPSARDLQGSHYNTMPELQKAEVDAALAKHGYAAADLAAHHHPRQLVCARTYRSFETKGVERFTKRQSTFDL